GATWPRTTRRSNARTSVARSALSGAASACFLGIDAQRGRQFEPVAVAQRRVGADPLAEDRVAADPVQRQATVLQRRRHRGARRQLQPPRLVPARPGAHHLDPDHRRPRPSATRTKSSTMRSASPWKPSVIAGPSRRLRGSKSRVRVTLHADSSSARNSQRPCSRSNGPSRSCMSMWCGGDSVFSVVNQVRNAPKPRSSRATTRLSPVSSTSAPLHQSNRRGYASMSFTRSNILAAECPTSALRWILGMVWLDNGRNGEEEEQREG